MKTVANRLYEGMFLVDSIQATADWQGVLDEIQRVLDRADAEVVSLKKWDDRRLTHEINRTSRGTYILTYFNCQTDQIARIERDVQLSELLMRVLILRTDQMNEDDLKKVTPLEAAVAAQDAAEQRQQDAADEAAAVAAEKAEAKAAAEVAAAEAEDNDADGDETPDDETA